MGPDVVSLNARLMRLRWPGLFDLVTGPSSKRPGAVRDTSRPGDGQGEVLLRVVSLDVGVLTLFGQFGHRRAHQFLHAHYLRAFEGHLRLL